MALSLSVIIVTIKATKLVGNLGAEPTTSDFTVVMHGDTYQAIDGVVLVCHNSYDQSYKACW